MIAGIVGIIARAIAEVVMHELKQRLDKVLDYDRVYSEHDNKKNEMIEELARAESEEERQAILDKIRDYHPKFK